MSLEAFLAMTEAEQLEHIDACAASGRLAELLHLHDIYVRWAELHQHDPTARGWLSLRVLARLLDVLRPGDIHSDGYRELAQDGRLREQLTPAALARVREESYSGILAPLLRADEPTRERFIAALSVQELRSLNLLLQRFASECGRPHHGRRREFAAVRRAVHDRVAERLALMPNDRSRGMP